MACNRKRGQDGEGLDVSSGQEQRTLRGHAQPVACICFSPDGKRLATTSSDYTAKVWDASNGQELLTLHAQRFSFDSICFSPDSKRLATTSAAKMEAKIWDACSGQELLILRGYGNDRFHGICFSPDGRRLATANQDIRPRSGTHQRAAVTCPSRALELCLSTRVSARTANGWRPQAMTRQRRFGTRPADKSYSPSAGTQAGSGASVSARTASGWRPPGLDKTAKIWDAASGQGVAYPSRAQRLRS